MISQKIHLSDSFYDSNDNNDKEGIHECDHPSSLFKKWIKMNITITNERD